MPPLGEGAAAAAVLKMKQERKKKARVSLTALTHFIPLKKTPPASLHSRDDRPTDRPTSQLFSFFSFSVDQVGKRKKKGREKRSTVEGYASKLRRLSSEPRRRPFFLEEEEEEEEKNI